MPSRIIDELRQTRPFPRISAEVLVALLRTSDVLRWELSSFLEPHGITLQQYNVLRILRGAGTDGLPTLEIAERMIEHAPGITRLLDRLEGKGLVERWRCPEDRRQVLCRLTTAGAELLADLDEPVLCLDDALVAGLAADDLEALLRALERIRDNAPSCRT